jgi:hypothetical protein
LGLLGWIGKVRHVAKRRILMSAWGKRVADL